MIYFYFQLFPKKHTFELNFRGAVKAEITPSKPDADNAVEGKKSFSIHRNHS